MLHNVLIDKISYQSKPASFDAGAISNRIGACKSSLDIYELARAVESGRTFVLASLVDEKRTDDAFAESSLVYVDMDNSLTPDGFKDLANHYGLPPALMYYSFSQEEFDKPNLPTHKKPGWRYRVIWQLNEAITDRFEYRAIIAELINMFGGDGNCKDSTRLVYGGKSECVFHLDDIYINPPHIKPQKQARVNAQLVKRNVSDELTQFQAEYLLNFIYKFTAPMMLDALAGSRYESLKSAVLGSSQGLGLMQIEFMTEDLATDIIYSLLDQSFANWDHDIDTKLPPLIKFGQDKITDFIELNIMSVLSPVCCNNDITQWLNEMAYRNGRGEGLPVTRHQANIIKRIYKCGFADAVNKNISDISIELWNQKSFKLLDKVWYEALDYIIEDWSDRLDYIPTNFERVGEASIISMAKLTPDYRFILQNLPI